MTNLERAKQFLPFDSLKGLREELAKREARRMRVKRRELSEEEKERLSASLRQATRGTRVSVCYYADGTYFDVVGTVTDCDTLAGALTVAGCDGSATPAAKRDSHTPSVANNAAKRAALPEQSAGTLRIPFDSIFSFSVIP